MATHKYIAYLDFFTTIAVLAPYTTERLFQIVTLGAALGNLWGISTKQKKYNFTPNEKYIDQN